MDGVKHSCHHFVALFLVKTDKQKRFLLINIESTQEQALQPTMSALNHDANLPAQGPYPPIPCLFMCLSKCCLNIDHR